jgi:FtsP/CotA-like multicopper oxidase with cupredoxin domain
MNKKRIVIVCWLLSFIIFSGCRNDETSFALNSPSQIQKAYDHEVNFKKTWREIKINLTPHVQKTQFYDSWPETTLWSYSDTLEPIVVRAKQWDRLEVSVVNNLPQETSVHRHGIRVPNKEDGVPGVTQEPIPVWGSYTYNIPLKESWTFFFHPHINTVEQMARWLYGILIVEPEVYPFTFDQEFIRALKDYRLNEDGTINENFKWMADFTHGWRLWNTYTINNSMNPTYEAKPWNMVFLRLLNPSNARIYSIDMTEQSAQVVGTDGWFVSSPYDAGIIQLWPGERVEILLKMWNKKIDIIDSYFSKRPRQLATIIPESLSRTYEQTIGSSNFPDIPDWSLLSQQEPDEIIQLWGVWVMWWDMAMMWWAQRWWTINNWVRPDSNQELYWKLGELRVVRLQNNSRRDHPMHLHWDFFQVLWVNSKPVPRHGWKDTINVPAKSYTDLAIIPTNPGTRMFHCHVIEHAHFGMMTTVVVE